MGEFISELRKESGLTQKQIGDKLGITDNSVSKWERGINSPDIYYLAPLSEIFHVSVKELLNGQRNNKKKEKIIENRSKVLEVKSLSKSFGRKRILNNVNLSIYEGDIVGLIGPNGAGKTTLIKSMLGLLKIDSGSVCINNFDIKKDFEKAMSNIGAIIEKPDLYENLSGIKNIKITSILNNIKDKEYVNKVIRMVKLNTRIDDKVKKYSLGMKQRLALANAIIKKPRLLILDEPTNGLDPLGIKELREIIKDINKEMGISVLISSHILSEIENVCDKIIIIDNGYVIEELDVEDIRYLNISLEDEFLNKTSGSRSQIGGEELDENH